MPATDEAASRVSFHRDADCAAPADAAELPGAELEGGRVAMRRVWRGRDSPRSTAALNAVAAASRGPSAAGG